ncbi:MAG: ATP-binding protein [Burkholderiales bacterium]|nr:ATP-binding protein [Burkholderiales bacterium]
MTDFERVNPEPLGERSDRQSASQAADPTENAIPEAQTNRRTLRSAALNDGPDRAYYLENHPLNQRPVKVLTLSIRESFLVVSAAIKFKRPGCSFSAKFRSGKSTALLMIKESLPTVMPQVAYGLISAKDHDTVTERVYWGDHLIALELVTDGTAQERQNRLRAAIISACIQAGGRHFCLLIDEGQNWNAREYTFLRDLANQLREQDGYILTTIIFGDPRLDELSSMFREKRKDLWARFLMKPQPFFGIRNIDDLRFFLAEHDSAKRCEYPAGSGISYTEFFLPSAYESGWRLGEQAQCVWDAFVRAAAKVNREVNDIGMQWVGETVIHFLTAQMANDVPGFIGSSEKWDDAIVSALFIDSLI